jgi:hypothetical protein
VRGEHALHQRGAFPSVGDVAGLDLDPRVRGGQLMQRRRVPGDTDDHVAAPRERQRALAADPGRRAGDEDDPAAREGDHARDVPSTPRLKHLRPGSGPTSPAVAPRPTGVRAADEQEINH